MVSKKVDNQVIQKVYLVHNHNAGKQTFFAAMHRSVERLADEFIAMYGPAAFSYYRINTFNDAQSWHVRPAMNKSIGSSLLAAMVHCAPFQKYSLNGTICLCEYLLLVR